MAKSGWKRGKGPDEWKRLMERRRKNVAKYLGKSIEECTDAVKDPARDKAIVAKRVSQQDAPGGKPRVLSRRTPVRSRLNRKGLTGAIWCQRFWTAARSKAIRDIYARYGLGQQLLRRWLYVRRGEFVAKGRRGLREIVKVNLSKDAGLRQWAINTKQYLRHVLYITDGRVLRDLVLLAALGEAQPTIKRSFRAAIQRGLKKR